MLCLASLAMLIGAPLAGPRANLLPNPGFETVADGRPADWSSHNFRTGGVAQVEDGGHDSVHCVALESRDETERIAWRAVADLPPDTPFVAAGGWYRTDGVKAQHGKGASLRVHFHGKVDGRMREIGLRQAFFAPSEAWTKTDEQFFPVPDGAERIELQVFNWLTPGVTRWDDVWIRPVSDQEFAAQPMEVQLAARPIPTVTLEAEDARLDPARAAVLAQDSFASKQGVSLKAGQTSHVDDQDAAPDLVFSFTAAAPGRYRVQTHSAVGALGAELMRKARGKQDSLYLRLQIDEGRLAKRVVFVPWRPADGYTSTLGKFSFSGQPQEIKVWLPEGVQLDLLRISPYVPPQVPEVVQHYQPTIVPPKSHPRLWVNAESLPRIRANLERAENTPVWAKLKERAARPFEFSVKPNTEVHYNRGLESAAVDKAFVCLMTGDEASGRDSANLILAYLPAVEFGNLLDITREVGRAIYSASLVYDWCYDLLTPAEREIIRTNLMRLADEMECGWPPFLQSIINGHGGEGQINRDLLSMAIAIYDEDPVPYQYCSHCILEQLVPERRFEYQSPRHNQGVSYGPYRYGWELTSAWLFRRMTGHPVFDDNLGGVYYQWLYMRVPDNRALRDGDGFSDARPANLGQTTLLNYAYSDDPVVKWDFFREGGMDGDPLMVLLLNDPDLKAADGLDGLPLTKDFGPVLSSMIARTGWNMGRNLSDVVVEMKGGGYHFGNHQHADAGSFQIYWRGLQAVDLGEYHFYGTPYDNNFNKRSIAHSLMLVVDPDEKFTGTTTNDGGTRNNRSCPRNIEQVTSDPQFANGTVLSSSFGPDANRPLFSHFSIDLTSAYSDKLKRYQRSFCFLNLGQEEHPAALLVLDDLTCAKPEFKKYWQINTLNPPDRTADGAVLHNEDLGLKGKVDLHLLRPGPDARTLEILSGRDSTTVDGKYFEPPFPDRPESNGHRLMFSPKGNHEHETFLTVMTMDDEEAEPLPVHLAETDTVYVVTLADRAVVLGKTGALLQDGFTVDLPAGQTWQLLIAGAQPGMWSVKGDATTLNVTVEEARHTAFAVVPGGQYQIRPGAVAGAPEFKAAADLVPAASRALSDRVFVAGEVLPKARVTRLDDRPYVPAQAVAQALGLTCSATADELQLKHGTDTAVFRADADRFTLNGLNLSLPAPVRRQRDTWLVPALLMAALTGRGLVAEEASNTVEFSSDPLPLPREVLWCQSAQEPDLDKLRLMLADLPDRTDYWAAQGENVGFELALRQPTKLAGVGIRWHQGDRRQAKFALETSLDGLTWERVFEGTSSGKTAGLETYKFRPCEARFVKFAGFGNTANQWNSLVHFEVVPAG